MYKWHKITHSLEGAYRPQLAEWVQFAGLALGIGSSILGGLSSANAAKRAEQLRREQDARNNAWFNRKYNESYIDTAAGRNAIRQAQDYARTMTKRAEGAAAVTGGTDAAVAQAKESANKMIGDTIGNLAAQDTARKESAEATHLQQQAQSTAQQMQTQQMRANAIAQAASGTSNALIQGAAMLGDTSGSTKLADRMDRAFESKDAGTYARTSATQVNTNPAPSSPQVRTPSGSGGQSQLNMQGMQQQSGVSVSGSSPQLSQGIPTRQEYAARHGENVGSGGLSSGSANSSSSTQTSTQTEKKKDGLIG